MRTWLFKTEPNDFSIRDLRDAPDQMTGWDGVRNYQARNFMREMAVGDRGFFYHSQKEKSVVGIVEVCAEAHLDSTTDDDRWECVDINAVAPNLTPVTLDMIKADPRLADVVRVKNSRLSVQPVTEEEWNIILALGGSQS